MRSAGFAPVQMQLFVLHVPVQFHLAPGSRQSAVLRCIRRKFVQCQRQGQRLLWRHIKRRALDGDLAASERGDDARNQVIEIGACPTSISDSNGSPLFFTSSSESANGTTSSDLECRITVPGFTVVAVPHRFHAGQSNTSVVEPESMFIATAPPRLEPTTTSGRCLSNSDLAILMAASKSSSGNAGLMTSWPWSLR